MFVDCVNEHLRLDREGTLSDIAYVLQNFEMPAHDLVPDWQRKGEMIERYRIYGGRQFAARVLLPTLTSLGIHRKESGSAAIAGAPSAPIAQP